jgi:chromosome partitioning protein
VQAPGSDTSPPGAPRRLGHVSRETADDDGAGEPVDVDGTADARIDDSGDPCADDTRKSSGADPTGQTAPVNADRQDQDGSRLMQDVSSRAGVGTQGWDPNAPAFGYDDHQRSNLVESLPRVDESTPLAFEVAEDARRRISLVGRSFPVPPHTRILTVANQKGGVGKTTTTVNVAAAMAQSGLNVIVLDIDPQGNASTALGIDHHADIPSLYDVVVEQRPLAQVLQSCPDIPNLLCAPATIDLAGAEIELVSLVAREVRLQKALRDYLDERRSEGLPRVDYVFIDCPPSLSLLTVNAFVAADEVFIPIQCEYYALEGLSQLLKHVELIRGHLNPTLHVSSILLTMYDGRTRLSSQVADEVRAHFPETVLKTTVPRSVRISEAPSHGQTVMTYDPASSGALSYLEAARELAEQVLGWAPASSEQEERA